MSFISKTFGACAPKFVLLAAAFVTSLPLLVMSGFLHMELNDLRSRLYGGYVVQMGEMPTSETPACSKKSFLVSALP